MNISNSLVSIIIPTYNRAELLKECVQSCINQIYRPIECVIVDDGSTDNTLEIVNSLVAKNEIDFFIKYIYQQNSGSQVARNNGIRSSTGEFIQFLDSDDILYPNKLINQVNFLKNNPDCDGVFGDWEKGSLESNYFCKAWDSEDMLTQLLATKIIVNFSFLFKKSIIDKIGEWDINIKRNQEIDFQARGVIMGGKFIHQDNLVGLWRIHSGVRIANSTKLKDVLHFFNKWHSLLIEKSLLNNQIKSGFANSLYWFVVQKENQYDEDNFNLLKKAYELNPNIGFMQTRKVKILSKVIGVNFTIKWWLYNFWKKNLN